MAYIVLVIFISSLVYLSLIIQSKSVNHSSFVEIRGNTLLPKDKYYKFAELDYLNDKINLDVSFIKDRLKKHPYVKTIEVVKDGQFINCKITERTFLAVLINDDEHYFISENLLLIPILPFTNRINWPVINNPNIYTQLNTLNVLNDENDIITGLKLIESIKLSDPELYNNLSEVDLRNGKDILLYFSHLTYPVIIGRGNEIRKSIYFTKLWKILDGKEINSIIKYVDVRYSQHIFLGLSEELTEMEG
ncbi:cell division protein FtsQ/DivIB [Bacteroidota bacterium]